MTQGLVFVYIPEIIHYSAGPLPGKVCLVVSVMRHATFLNYILYFDAISVMK